MPGSCVRLAIAITGGNTRVGSHLRRRPSGSGILVLLLPLVRLLSEAGVIRSKFEDAILGFRRHPVVGGLVSGLQRRQAVVKGGYLRSGPSHGDWTWPPERERYVLHGGGGGANG